jgi:predicted transcriptional regulator
MINATAYLQLKAYLRLKALGLSQKQISHKLNVPLSTLTAHLTKLKLTNDSETYFIKEIVRSLKRDGFDYVFEQWQVDRVLQILPNVKFEHIDWYYRLTL